MEMCIEKWAIGKTGWSCVKTKGRLERPFTSTETGTKKCDLNFDYVSYKVYTQIGRKGEEATKSQFTTTVDFDKFRTTTTKGGVAVQLALGSLVAALVATVF